MKSSMLEWKIIKTRQKWGASTVWVRVWIRIREEKRRKRSGTAGKKPEETSGIGYWMTSDNGGYDETGGGYEMTRDQKKARRDDADTERRSKSGEHKETKEQG